ncbi:glutamate receptor 1-like [Pollicipes pollicipes]|uniref:glutamate receptor 1-like n=1 Tax=Pollicipes pollicipes TaxID=41117 RepID=UPI001885364B|nr:glutamate receptor 1-like [Pollicipes pollicipes]
MRSDVQCMVSAVLESDGATIDDAEYFATLPDGADLTVEAQFLTSSGRSEGHSATHPLRVILFDDPPFTTVSRGGGGNVTFSGFLVELWAILALQARLHFRLEERDVGGFGYRGENGTWTGLVGELAYGRADVALSWLSMQTTLKAVLDYVDAAPVMYDAYGFFLRADGGGRALPALTPELFGSLLRPLSVGVWLTLLASLAVTTTALRLVVRLSPATIEDGEVRDTFGWGACLLASFMTLVGQGWALLPRSPAARIVALCSWAVGIVVCANYTALTASTLTTTPEALPKWRDSSDPELRALWRLSEAGGRRRYITSERNSSLATTERRVLSYQDVDRLYANVGAEACLLRPDKPLGTNELYRLHNSSSKDYVITASFFGFLECS